MEVSFRFKAAPQMVFVKTNEYDIEQMRKHDEYEEIKEEPKQEVKKVGRPKKTKTGEE